MTFGLHARRTAPRCYSTAADPQAKAMGERLFLTYCVQCHGSDARGSKGFPNLADTDWQWGGDPATIEKTILEGRMATMPPMGAALGGAADVENVANFVLSLSGSGHDAAKAVLGKEKFAVCAACHGQAPSGNQFNGAGSTATVLQHVRSTQTLMANWAPVQNLSASDLAAVATFIRDQLPGNNPSTPQNTALPVNVSGHITFTNQAWSAFTSVEVVTPPTNGMLSAFTGTSATYTPNNGFAGTDSNDFAN